MSSGSSVGMLGWTPLQQRGRIVSWTRGQVRVRLTGHDGRIAWIATAPGISACGPSPEAAIYRLRERAERALEATK